MNHLYLLLIAMYFLCFGAGGGHIAEEEKDLLELLQKLQTNL